MLVRRVYIYKIITIIYTRCSPLVHVPHQSTTHIQYRVNTLLRILVPPIAMYSKSTLCSTTAEYISYMLCIVDYTLSLCVLSCSCVLIDLITSHTHTHTYSTHTQQQSCMYDDVYSLCCITESRSTK